MVPVCFLVAAAISMCLSMRTTSFVCFCNAVLPILIIKCVFRILRVFGVLYPQPPVFEVGNQALVLVMFEFGLLIGGQVGSNFDPESSDVGSEAPVTKYVQLVLCLSKAHYKGAWTTVGVPPSQPIGFVNV